MTWITGYGCTTAAGDGIAPFWRGLEQGTDHSHAISLNRVFWPHAAGAIPAVKAYTRPHAEISQRESLLGDLLRSWKEARSGLTIDGKIGVILASTKGFIDDVIWTSTQAPKQDTLMPLLEDFVAKTGLKTAKTAGVSNACASTLAACFLAQTWLERQNFDHVIVLAADSVGAFVIKGFQALHVITPDQTRPFDGARSGFFLGEATAALVLSAKPQGRRVRLAGMGLDAEGFAVTKPSQSGESLRRAAALALKGHEAPDFIVAHGTGTPANDSTEDHVFHQLFSAPSPWITGTKWSVGHTLAVSGALDLIAGCEALRHQRLFALANTQALDSSFQGRYVTTEMTAAHPQTHPWTRFLITSLGFGGLHAALLLESGRE